MDVLWSVSADGTTGWLAANSGPNGTGWDILRIDLGTLETTVVVRTLFDAGAPDISPDGSWLLYRSDVSGRQEV